ncbi:hypothetical protein BDZ89DRAFT_109158 [Hymenopellis radicata]|nr:hypothetical protein BDZ89DRAFT_109158 [Hymenopellis radicata]
MNYLDPLDVAATSTSTPPPEPEQSLNEEVTQVIGQFNRFWGGFRKQSETALAAARKDFSEVVTQAQQNLHKYTASQSEEPVASSSSTAETRDVDSEKTPPASTPTEQASASAPTLNFFSRIQSALPPNIAATVQNNIPESLKNPDFVQIRATLATEFQRVQGVTRAQAEEYVHKSEALLREAVKEAGEVLKDAVKVIPPEDPSSSGLIWDGSDMWMLPTPASEAPSGKGKGKASSTHAVATRAEALLKRLKHDSGIIRHDPEADSAAKEQYVQWVATEVNAKGGMEGDEWSKKISAVVDDASDGAALKANEDTLVPSEMTRETFWTRFFFRAHQISIEEDKRKALIQGSLGNDEDFSWEDEEDEQSITPSASIANTAATAEPSKANPPSQTATPATSSPRESSEESYDVVSSESQNESKVADDKKVTDSDDSDWE